MTLRMSTSFNFATWALYLPHPSPSPSSRDAASTYKMKRGQQTPQMSSFPQVTTNTVLNVLTSSFGTGLNMNSPPGSPLTRGQVQQMGTMGIASRALDTAPRWVLLGKAPSALAHLLNLYIRSLETRKDERF